MGVIGSTKFRLESRMMVDLFGNSGDTRETRKYGSAGPISLRKLVIELQR